jgi:uncharacterized protein involved in exopolysaccharide biosynthesis/Mrp family chromosome partitioning ATPase
MVKISADMSPAGPVGGPASEPAGEGGALSPIQAVLLRKWSILAFACVVAVLMAVYARGLETQYSAEAGVSIDARQLRVINAESLLTKQMMDREQLATEMAPLAAIGLARDVVRDLSLNTNPMFCPARPRSALSLIEGRGPPAPLPCDLPVDVAARMLMGDVDTRTDGMSYVIYIKAVARTPQLAADIANAYARAFIAERRNASHEVAAQARAWLATYAEKLRLETAEADAAVARYESTQGLTPVRGGTLASQTLVDMNGALTALTGEIAEKRSAVAQLEAAAHAGGDLSANSLVSGSPLLQQLLARAAETTDQEARLRTQFGNFHPDVLSTEAQERRLQQQISVEVGKAVRNAEAQLAAMEGRRSALETRVRSLQVQIGGQGQADVQLQALQRDADSKRQVYQSVLSRQMELEAQHGMEQADARIVSEALPPLTPSAPHRAMLVAGGFLGACGLGATLAFPLALLSRRFRDAEHIEEEIGLPVLGMFPKPPNGTAPHDIVQSRAGTPEAEAVLRILPNILRERAPGKLGQSIAIASALPGEGKTSFAISLARASAQLGVSVLLLDCDLRRPSVDRLLRSGKPARLTGPETVTPVSQQVTSLGDREPDIVSLTSAMPDKPRFVSGQDVSRLLRELTRKYDLVLLDAPPVLVLADALMLATAADSVIMVVDWRTTPRRAVMSAVQILRRQGADFLGAVTSKADLRKDAHASSHYFHYQSAYFTGADGRPPR